MAVPPGERAKVGEGGGAEEKHTENQKRENEKRTKVHAPQRAQSNRREGKVEQPILR